MRFAYIDVRHEFSLQETAQRLSVALSINFDEEMSGKYEEYPAYIAVSEGFIFSLLGFPELEYDLRDEKDNSYYQLQVEPLGKNLPSATKLVKIINGAGALNCRVCSESST